MSSQLLQVTVNQLLLLDDSWSQALQQCATAVHVVGLDINAVVGIAFAAFTIGILLTGALWFIHTRTGRVLITKPFCTNYMLQQLHHDYKYLANCHCERDCHWNELG